MNERLFAKFQELNPQEQVMLLILSVAYAPIGQNNLQDLLVKTQDPVLNKLRLSLKSLRESASLNQLLQSNSNGWSCREGVADCFIRLAAKQNWFKAFSAQLIAERRPFYSANLYILHTIKQIRIFLHQENALALVANLERFKQEFPSRYLLLLQDLFVVNYDAEWFSELDDAIRLILLSAYIQEVALHLAPWEQILYIFDTFYAKRTDHPKIISIKTEVALYQAKSVDFQALTKLEVSIDSLYLLGAAYFLRDQNEQALQAFQAALKLQRKQANKRNIGIGGLHAYFLLLALFKSRTTQNLKLLQQLISQSYKTLSEADPFYLMLRQLQEGLAIYQNNLKLAQSRFLMQRHEGPLGHLFNLLMLQWLGEQEAIGLLEKNHQYLSLLAKYCLQAQENGHYWYAACAVSLLNSLSFRYQASIKLSNLYSDSPYRHLLELLPQVSPWERSLEALTQLKSSQAPEQNAEQRLIWLLHLENDHLSIEPREQKMGKNGQWTKGRVLALKRLHEESEQINYLSEQDKQICSHIGLVRESSYYYGYYNRDQYEISLSALQSLKGHPHVYWREQQTYARPLEITEGYPQLLVKEQGENLLLSLYPFPERETYYLQRITNGLLFYAFTENHRQVAKILGEAGLSVPAGARQRVLDSIAAIASLVTVQSDIGGSSRHAELVEADSRLHVHLQPAGPGLQIEVFIQPFANGGPLYKPGQGGVTVLAEIDGQQLQTNRDFALEHSHFQRMLEDCPALGFDPQTIWIIDDPELALESLLQLQNLNEENIVLEWPKGRKIHLSREVGLGHVHFSIRKEQDWFSLQGELQIDQEQVLSTQQLVNLLHSSAGRFLKLENGQIITLTRELRQRLDDLAGLGQLKQDSLHFHPLAAQTLEEITRGMEVEAHQSWLTQRKKNAELAEIQPSPPSTLKCELRDYQLEGFQWLSRLAHWGAGACLADEMGLGKTIQALALILARAPDGPTLILAPTSVCINWLEEINRFAPTLNVFAFGNGDRQSMLEEAGAFDVIVCSYGLLQTEIERLSGVKWRTLVADEAQAIKNTFTKRSKAAMSLQADFKMITTGTPIENHLGELWNLFNFINPGLLGSLQQFNERYAHAIENLHDKGVQKRLRNLLRPFILRRLKNDVLRELPARTDVSLHIELSDQERSLYEVFRRKALESISEIDEQSASQQQFKILAEIIKLRQLCCHPGLVMPEAALGSSKLQAFEELLDELIESGHKALVFSQFVSYLKLIAELLDKKGVNYHYLDGSTPVAHRKKSVNAFQAGEGDVFLISLKAGGTGLNLTAADYVIHMDPWWNPAVEDQASDRAHRMGQIRPVTVYRLIAKDTIEDKIVELHHHKRELATNLLEGGELSSKMSIQEMMALIGSLD